MGVYTSLCTNCNVEDKWDITKEFYESGTRTSMTSVGLDVASTAMKLTEYGRLVRDSVNF